MDSSKVAWLALLLGAAALIISLWPSDGKKKDTRTSSTSTASRPVTSAPAQSASRSVSGPAEPSMVEKGYRFSELYFAGRDGNWKYAELQAGKLNQIVQIMAQRNPKRAETAAAFLEEDMPRLLDAIENQDGRAFDRALQELRDACNTCHQNDGAEYIHVVVPDQRVAPVRSP
jgi:hypothetical protein